MLTNVSNILANGAEAATDLITSAQWDTVAQTVVDTAKTAIAPALIVLAVMLAVPLAKKLFKTIGRG